MNEEATILNDFSSKMLEKINLRKNRYAPMGWKTMNLKRLVFLLKKEIEEMEEEGASVGDEAVDVANYAMFIWEISKK